MGDADPHRTPDEKANLKGFFTDFTEGRVDIVFPTFERTEILACQIPDGGWDLINLLMDRSNFHEVPINRSISELAGQIRNDFYAKRTEGQEVHKLGACDAIVLATGIRYECSAVFSYDGARADGKDRKLLGLDGTDMNGSIIRICRPESDNPEM
jgi:hypothetical protein